MTRINVIPVQELSDQHLIAEYHELPRVLKQDIDTTNAPERYRLGKGHLRWAKHHSLFVEHRYLDILKEMRFRGFKTTHTADGLAKPGFLTDYFVSAFDIETNRQRIREKYAAKPNWYRWTKRVRPNWL